MVPVEPEPSIRERVAALYVLLGASVEVSKSIAGVQIDVYVEGVDSTGAPIRTAVECKSSSAPIGFSAVASIAAVAALLKQRKLIDNVAIVASAGYAANARRAAAEYGVELIDLASLEANAKPASEQLDAAINGLRVRQRREAKDAVRPKRVFVIMPFAPEFDDIFVLGIREVVEKLGLVVERADDIEHNENILGVVQQSIRGADLVIGEVTGSNPNCFYEIGYSHALAKPTILIARAGHNVPFDLRALNLVFYTSIVELRNALATRVCATLKLPAE